MTAGLIRIASAPMDRTAKRLALNDRVEVWIETPGLEPGGQWVDISAAVKSIRPRLDAGSVAMCDLTFYTVGVDLDALILTPHAIAGLREFLAQIDEDGRL